MTARSRLGNRRVSETFSFECKGPHYTASTSRFPDDKLAEIFIGNTKAGSHFEAAAKDSAIVAGIALQYGVPADVIRHALLRDTQGRASSPLGLALDTIAKGAPA